MCLFSKLVILFLLITLVEPSSHIDFTYNGFLNSNLSLNGAAEITPDGLLQLTNLTDRQKGHAFYHIPLHLKNTSNGNVLSFSTTFVAAIISKYFDAAGHGLALVLSPSTDFSGALPSQYLGLFNTSSNGASNHVVAVELDTILNSEFGDINNNHVGIDINSLTSTYASPAAYYSNETLGFKNLSLSNGSPVQIWVEYDGNEQQLDVTVSPAGVAKPIVPLLSKSINLASVLSDYLYVGFSAATGSFETSHYILGWSFRLNGQAKALDVSHLPSPPKVKVTAKSKLLTVGLPVIVVSVVVIVVSCVTFGVWRHMKFKEFLEDWEVEYGPQRFLYKELYIATKGFMENQIVGIGGFGRVYRGTVPATQAEVAVKRVSHDSRQGIREFIAEIASMGRLRHRNLVQLLGYSRRKGELLLVYELMPNGSLDKLLFDHPKSMLSWPQRFQIIKGVASALLYLHEEWEQIVVHRDIKASNILLDGDMNGRLGDFGLARLYERGGDPRTTHVVGTFGYIAPELATTGKASTRTDVYAFGIFLLEVACGRRPIQPQAQPEELALLDWVLDCWKDGQILEAVDPKLGTDYGIEEAELVLKTGLLCSQQNPDSRPTMRQVMKYLNGDAPLPERSMTDLSADIMMSENEQVYDNIVESSLSSSGWAM